MHGITAYSCSSGPDSGFTYYHWFFLRIRVLLKSILPGLPKICLQVSIQKLIIESYRKRSKNLLLQALLLEPLVHHVGNAERMLDDMLELQSNYLPAFE